MLPIRKLQSGLSLGLIKPLVGQLKLNSDGTCRGNPGLGGRGGVIRDDNGSLVFAYSSFYGSCTNTLAELRAIYRGVLWLYTNGFEDAIIEMDSKVLYYCLSQGFKPPWSCIYLIRAILFMKSERHFTFSHCFREANSVADGLANLGVDSSSETEFFLTADLPRAIKGNLLLDAAGFSYVRVS